PFTHSNRSLEVPSFQSFLEARGASRTLIYGFLLRVCALAYEALLPEPGTERFRFQDVLADPQGMGFIFQDFVRNFFRLEQNRFSVKGDQLRWDVDLGVGFGHHLLPLMNTDTSLFDGTHDHCGVQMDSPHSARGAGR